MARIRITQRIDGTQLANKLRAERDSAIADATGQQPGQGGAFSDCNYRRHQKELVYLTADLPAATQTMLAGDVCQITPGKVNATILQAVTTQQQCVATPLNGGHSTITGRFGLFNFNPYVSYPAIGENDCPIPYCAERLSRSGKYVISGPASADEAIGKPCIEALLEALVASNAITQEAADDVLETCCRELETSSCLDCDMPANFRLEFSGFSDRNWTRPNPLAPGDPTLVVNGTTNWSELNGRSIPFSSPDSAPFNPTWAPLGSGDPTGCYYNADAFVTDPALSAPPDFRADQFTISRTAANGQGNSSNLPVRFIVGVGFFQSRWAARVRPYQDPGPDPFTLDLIANEFVDPTTVAISGSCDSFSPQSQVLVNFNSTPPVDSELPATGTITLVRV